MTDFTAKLREALPCLLQVTTESSACWNGFATKCTNCLARAKVEAVVREMVAKVPHLYLDGFYTPQIGDHVSGPKSRENCIKLGGQCAFGDEKGTNNG